MEPAAVDDGVGAYPLCVCVSYYKLLGGEETRANVEREDRRLPWISWAGVSRFPSSELARIGCGEECIEWISCRVQQAGVRQSSPITWAVFDIGTRTLP